MSADERRDKLQQEVKRLLRKMRRDIKVIARVAEDVVLRSYQRAGFSVKQRKQK